MKTRKKSWSCCIFDKNVHENDKKKLDQYILMKVTILM